MMRRLVQQPIPPELLDDVDDSGLAVVEHEDGSEEVVWISRGANLPRRLRHQQGVYRLGALAIIVAFLAGLVLGLFAGSALGAEGCQTRECRMRVEVRPYRPWLHRVGECETGDYAHPYRVATGNGYFGRYQFSAATWRAAGGRGLPHHASPLEQDYRAVRWRKTIGNPHSTAGWPVCG